MNIRKKTPFCLMLMLTGCAVGPDFKAPDPPSITEYTRQPTINESVASHTPARQTQHLMEGYDIQAQWWEVFHSRALDALINEGLINSPTVAQAKARLKQAQEDFNAQFGSTMFPTIDGSVSAIHQQVNLQSFGITAFPNPPPFTLYNIGTSISYTLDLFGGNRRQLEALCAEVDYQRFELMASQLTLVGNIVTATIKSAMLKEQIKMTQEIIELQEKQLGITNKRYQSGGIAALEVISQRSQLDQSKATLFPLQKQLEQTYHQMAIYIGRPPCLANLPEIELDDLTLPLTLPISIPAKLMCQRPDVQAAEALLHQASANIGVATANLYPKINITGNLATEAPKIDKLFGPGSSVWNIGPTLMQPIFHGGALRAKKRSAIAAYDQALSAYQETVLQGIQNVADTLKAIEYDAKTLNARALTTEQSRKTYDITSQRYQAGGVSYVALLDAQRQYYQALMDEVQSRADRYSDTAALFQALGGGWWQDRPTLER